MGSHCALSGRKKGLPRPEPVLFNQNGCVLSSHTGTCARAKLPFVAKVVRPISAPTNILMTLIRYIFFTLPPFSSEAPLRTSFKGFDCGVENHWTESN